METGEGMMWEVKKSSLLGIHKVCRDLFKMLASRQKLGHILKQYRGDPAATLHDVKFGRDRESSRVRYFAAVTSCTRCGRYGSLPAYY